MFAYGQTGSGKTFSMAGAAGLRSLQTAEIHEPGMYQLSAVRLFEQLIRKRGKAVKATVSFTEIYGAKVQDLLKGRQEVKMLEDSKGHTRLFGAREAEVSSAAELCSLIAQGSQLRMCKKMTQNNESSRSHAVLSVQLYSRHSGKPCGRFSLIDLAGNERGADNLVADSLARQESAAINKSLLALKECIRSLAKGKADDYTPFRQSKITTLLRESLTSSRARVCVLNCVSPGSNTSEYTLNTLRYAAMLKSL
jgi:kinesin family protein 2/24